MSEIKSEYNVLDVVNIRLVKEPSLISDAPVDSKEKATELIRELLSEFDREVFAVLNLATDGKPISLNIVSVGTLNEAMVSPREVFKSCILSNAANFIAYHCHPSGSVKPSRSDLLTTQRLKDAGELLNIKLVDHIIVGCAVNKTFSFAQKGLLSGESVEKSYAEYKKELSWER